MGMGTFYQMYGQLLWDSSNIFQKDIFSRDAGWFFKDDWPEGSGWPSENGLWLPLRDDGLPLVGVRSTEEYGLACLTGNSLWKDPDCQFVEGASF